MDADLELDHQLCFALYAAARVTQGAYRSVLGELDLTYPQYLVLLALWDHDGLGVRELGERLHLDSGNLSPLLGRMESRGVVTRRRDQADARRVTVHLTDEGHGLRSVAGDIQRCLGERVHLSSEEIHMLHDLATRLVANATPEGEAR